MNAATRFLTMLALLCVPVARARQSALDPAGPNAERIAELWWAMLIGGTLIFVLVIVLLAIGLLRGRGSKPRPLGARRSRLLVIAGGVMLPLAVTIPFAIASFTISRQVDGAAPPDALTIEVIGRLWWWEVHYQNAAGERIATTANEIHIPVGRPVEFLLSSDNVIHSFWVPNLQGKMDLIPGQLNRSWLQADQARVYRGQCAEFCGTQHALMAFLLVAREPSAFAQWLQRQQRDAAEPRTEAQARGRAAFLRSGCGECHSVRGTPAAGTRGPDLTHIGSRLSLAAATLPNRRGQLGGWVSDPQHVKPGSLMPATELEPAELKTMIAYLESLR